MDRNTPAVTRFGLTLAALFAIGACGSEDPATIPQAAAGGATGSGATGSGATGDTGSGASSGSDSGPAPTEPALTFTAVALGVSNATDFAFVPGHDDEILVIQKEGGVHRLRLGGSTATELEQTTIDVFSDEGCGLHSLAFDPAFVDNGFVYLGRCADALTSTLSRYELGALSALEASAAEIMSLTISAQPDEFWHRWGSIGFEPDGETMWGLLGDHFLRDLAQDPSTRHGSILRFKPNREAGGSGFEPAEGNAFDDDADADPAVYAWGLRSPWRGHRDSASRFWVGDVGQSTWEEVNLVSAPGQNLGWPLAEGECEEDCADLRDPLIAFGRSSEDPYVAEDPLTEPATKRAVWVGVTYEAPSVDRYFGLLDGLLLYGDFFTGWVRGVKVDEDGAIDVDRSLGHLVDVTSMRLGPDGYLYALTLDGKLHRAEQIVD
jgi:glucose/arabinose dehydrogenase